MPNVIDAASAPVFARWGTSHLAVFLLMGFALALLIKLARLPRPAWQKSAERVLAVILAVNWPLTVITHLINGDINLDNTLPLHVCNLTSLLGAWALWTGSPRASEGLYFWGIAGALQGLITPPLTRDFPDLEYFGFFLLHGGIVLAALHVVFGRDLPHRPGAVARMWLWGTGYQLVVGGINWLIGTNYGFLCHKPEGKSLFDLLGPWPWYLLSLQGVGLVLFTVLDLFLRFRPRRSASHHQKTPAVPSMGSHTG